MNMKYIPLLKAPLKYSDYSHKQLWYKTSETFCIFWVTHIKPGWVSAQKNTMHFSFIIYNKKNPIFSKE